MKRIIILSLLFLCISLNSARAVMPDEALADPALETRARALSRDLRCVVCQGQSVDDSGAGVAADLRHAVRTRLIAGDTDAQVLDFLRQRYGDVILMRPPIGGRTALLWIAPGLALAAGLWVAWRLCARGKGQT